MAIVSGNVEDPQGNPIQDVLVSLDSFYDTTVPTASYEVEVPNGDYTLKAVKRGYETGTKQINVTSDMTVNITMVPA